MAVTEQVSKNQCTIGLDDGTTAGGKPKVVNVSLGTLSGTPGDWNADKAMAIVSALSDCLTKSVYVVRHIQTTDLID